MEQDWLYALLGGGLIGLAATLLLLLNGRVTGISGIIFGALKPVKKDALWRYKFIGGLIIGGLISAQFMENPFHNTSDRSTAMILGAGLLVGFGTKMGSGCTSGHGVCGLSRLSPRSVVATMSFILAGMFIVAFFSKIFGGVL